MNGLVDGLVRSEFQRLAQTSTCESVYVGDVINRVHEAVDPSALAPSTPYIGLEHMPRGSMFIDRWANADGLDSGKSQFEISDVLFGKLRPNFRKVGIAPISGICSTDILVLRPKSGFSVALVLAIATSEEVLGPAIAASSGTKMPRVSWDYISKLRVSIPDASGCAEFADVIGPMIKRTMRALLENRILENTRDALLPELLSGRLRVRDAEKVVEDSV
jgi:type I restriction enzyme S subunit